MKLDKGSGKIALASIFAAMSVAIMFAGSVLPFGEYSVVAIAGIFMIPIVIEAGRRYALIAYAAASVLSLILVPNKEIAVLFLVFFGIYPILKSVFESYKSRTAEFLFKFTFFNAMMIAEFFVSISLLGIPKEEFTVFGFYVPWAFLAAGNVIFILYDICLTQMILLYINVIREKIFRRL